jgi:hypothetical protein
VVFAVACSAQHGTGVVTGSIPLCGPDLPSYSHVHLIVQVRKHGEIIRSTSFDLGRNGRRPYRFELPVGTYAIGEKNFPMTAVTVTANHTTTKDLPTLSCL